MPLCTAFSTCSTSSVFLRIFTFFVFGNSSFCFMSAGIIGSRNIALFIFFAPRLHIYFIFIAVILSLCLVYPDISVFFGAFFKDYRLQPQKMYYSISPCWIIRTTVLHLVLGISWSSPSCSIFLLFCFYKIPLTWPVLSILHVCILMVSLLSYNY